MCVRVVRGSVSVGQMGQQAGEETVERWGAQRLQASDIRFQGCVNKGSGSWGVAFTLGGGFHLGEMSR